MAINKSRMTRLTEKPLHPDPADVDKDSEVSFSQNPLTSRPVVKYAWAGGTDGKVGQAEPLGAAWKPHCRNRQLLATQVNYDIFHRMLDDYREAKRREGELEAKAKQ